MHPYVLEQLVADRQMELRGMAMSSRRAREGPDWRLRAGRSLVAVGLRLGLPEVGRASARRHAEALLLGQECC